MKKDIKITGKEFEEYYDRGNYVVSDLDYGRNPQTGEWDVPKIEWESSMGRFWIAYKDEDDRQHALDIYDLDIERFVLEMRGEESKRRLVKLYENQKVRTLKTLGGQFPELELLKSKF